MKPLLLAVPSFHLLLLVTSVILRAHSATSLIPLIALRAPRCNSEDVLLPNFVSWRSVKRTGRGTHVVSTAHFSDGSDGSLPRQRGE